MQNTSHRGCSERGFCIDWQWQILGGRYEIPRQYLENYGKEPTPKLPLIHVLIAVHFAIQDMFATPTNEVSDMPFGISLAAVYRGGNLRITLLNWLDPLRTGLPSPFHRLDLFAFPTVHELRQGWAGNIGGVRLVNVLDPNMTGFPALDEQEMNEFCGGPYLVHKARAYLTSYRVKAADRLAYVNLANYHFERSRANQHMLGYVFDQLLPPQNWYGVWPGCTVPNTQPWQPVRILVVPKIPSRYMSNNDHSVVVAYVPDHLPVRHPAPGFHSPALQRIQMFLCGPRYSKISKLTHPQYNIS